MKNSDMTINIFEDKLSYEFYVDEFKYDGRSLNIIAVDNNKKFNIIISNISIFLHSDAHEMWNYWEPFRHHVAGSSLFEVPPGNLKDYLTIADPFRIERSNDARVFCLFSHDYIFLMLFRLPPAYNVSELTEV